MTTKAALPPRYFEISGVFRGHAVARRIRDLDKLRIRS